MARLVLDIRREASAPFHAALTAASVFAGLAISAAILIAAGVPPAALADEFIVATLFDAQSLHAVLFQAAPLIMVGAGAAIAFRARFWNLGLEGQMIWGAIAATAVSLFEIGPPMLRLPLMFLAAIVAGMAWIALPLLLKQRLAVNEIVSTLLLNYVALNVLLHLLYGAWADPKDGFPHSPLYRGFERLPELPGGISSALVLALAAVAALAWLTLASRFGFHLRFVQAGPAVARSLGVPVLGVTVAATLLSGSLAASAGFVIVAAQEGRLTQSFFTGYGVSGVLIAFLARNNPAAAAIVALLVAILFAAGQNLQVFYQIPFAMVQLIQAIVVIAAAAADFFLRHRVRWVKGIG